MLRGAPVIAVPGVLTPGHIRANNPPSTRHKYVRRKQLLLERATPLGRDADALAGQKQAPAKDAL